MPTADRYSQYRSDQTTIWISKSAKALLDRERDGGEGVSAVVERMIGELRRLRRAAGIPEGGAPRAAKSAAKGASKGAAKGAAKSAAKGAAKGGARSAAKGAAKGASKAAAKGAGRGAKSAGKRAAAR